MSDIRVRNLKYNALGTIDCEVKHETLGWIPFTASDTDTEQSGRDIFAKAVAGEYGKVEKVDPAEVVKLNEVNKAWTDAAERAWRDAELLRADAQIMKAEDADPSAVGTVIEWRGYRIALRNWPQDVNFPNPNHRPDSPDGK